MKAKSLLLPPAVLLAVALATIALGASCDGKGHGDGRVADSSAGGAVRTAVEDSTARTAPAASPAGRWLLAPDPREDLVHAADDEASLRARLGDANVRRDTIWLAEGEHVMGTVLYADDPRQRLEVQWGDTAARSRPELVRVGSADSSAWRLAPGAGIGTSLAELEVLNGKPFELAGFGWDYGGTVQSWKGGRLAAAWGDRVVVRLQPRTDGSDTLLRQVQGDVLFPSTHPAMRALAPRVYDLLVRPR